MARFSASAPGGGQVGGGIAGNAARLDLQRLHDGLERFAHLGRGGVARRRILFQARRNHALQFGGDVGHDLAQIGRIGELDGADGLKIFGIGPRERMTAAGQFIENDAQRPDVGLHARLAGDELLGRHVADGSAARGVGRRHRRILGQRGLGGIEARIFRGQAARQAKVEDLGQAAIGEHHVLRLQVAMKDAQRVRGLQIRRRSGCRPRAPVAGSPGPAQ